MSCAKCKSHQEESEKLREMVQKLYKNSQAAPLDSFLHCACVNPELHPNKSGPAHHDMCYRCRGWRRAKLSS